MKYEVYFIALLLFASFNASTQEFIKSVNDSASYRFVRRINSAYWLYYSNKARVSTLTRMNASTTSIPSIRIDDLLNVFDMDVVDNQMFYVGMVRHNNTTRYAFGNVNLSQFPNGNAYYFLVDDNPYKILAMQETGGTDVYWAGYDSHTGKYCFTELLYTPQVQSWTFNQYIFNDAKYRIDDMAATTSYVVFTVRDITNNDGYIFSRPRNSSQTLNPSLYKITNQAHSTLLIEAATADTVYIVHSNSSSHNTLAVHKYTANCSTHVASRQLDAMALKYNSLNALDLTYDNSSKVLSILTNMVTTTSDNAIVWHIGDSQMLSGGLVYGHQYSGKHIESFDHLQGTARNIVATGPFIANVSSGIYRLKDNTWGNCSSSILTEFSLLEAASGNDNKTLGHFPIVKIRETLQKTIVVTTLSTECN